MWLISTSRLKMKLALPLSGIEMCVNLILCVFLTLLAHHGRTANALWDHGSFPLHGLSRDTFNHLTVDNKTGTVYVGAVNKLFKLDDNLELLATALTGPKADNSMCPPPSRGEETCTSPLSPMDNYNKILLINPEQSELITCGSIYQGACEVRDLFNISKSIEYYQYNDVFYHFVAANSPTASTVAFIAPGPPKNLKTHNVMYVASSYTGVDVSKLYRDQVPAISSRSISGNMFQFSYSIKDEFSDDHSHIHLALDEREHYPINYVVGFSSNGFSYFLTVQADDVELPTKNISKIVQICQKDKLFTSYVDIPIKCSKKGLDFDLIQAASVLKPGKLLAESFGIVNQTEEVLVATFARSVGNRWDSAVCVYSMKEIQDAIVTNVKKCYAGDKAVSGGGYISVGLTVCNKFVKEPTREKYLCNTDDTSHANIVGNVPMNSQAVLVYNHTQLTSVATTTTTDHTVAFLGTSTGTLKKVKIDSRISAQEYGSIIVDAGSPVNKDMKFDRTRQFLYVMSTNKITKVSISDCQSASTCGECLLPGDPFCGWCFLENRCTQIESCRRGNRELQWLSGEANKSCIYILDVSPSSVAVDEVKDLFLTINQLPAKGSYSCVFVDFGFSSPAQRMSYGLQCPTPDLNALGITFPYTDHRIITLALNSSESGILFLRENFTFYNCSSHRSCSTCTSSPWSCDWCIYDDKCMREYNTCQPGIVIGKNSQTSLRKRLVRKGRSSCPRLDDQANSEIYLPNSWSRQITLRGHYLPMPLPGQQDYRCVLQVRDRTIVVNASRPDANTVRCLPHSYSYLEPIGELRAKLYVVWGQGFRIDSAGLNVTLYKCDVIGANECGLCLNLNYKRPEFECHWCDGNCKFEGHCLNQRLLSCPAPSITYVAPLTGPLDGGTNITIKGHNLGSKFEDIQNNITVAGIPCVPIRGLYSPSQRIVCTTRAAGISHVDGPITILHGGRHVPYQEELFEYRDPAIWSVEPMLGPKSGGTTVTVYGKNLRTGGVVNAYIGGAYCAVKRDMLTDDQAICITSGVSAAGPRPTFTLVFDGARRTLNQTFLYAEDPVITRIRPLKSIMSGGLGIIVKGRNFISIQRPQMRTTSGTTMSAPTMCKVVDDDLITCPTPSAPLRARRSAHPRRVHRRSPNTMSAQIMFVMDGVMSVRDLSSHFPNLKSELEYFPDPVVQNFTEKDRKKLFKGEALIIEGQELNSAANQDDVKVWIGSQPCNVTSLSANQIVCTPPKKQPEPSDRFGQKFGALPQVQVTIGNREYSLGTLEYDIDGRFKFPMVAIVGIAAAGGFLLVVIIIILIIYRRQSTRAERIYRKMQIQLDNLESNVRNECKQAFAELQTDMTDLTGDLVAAGIPFWDYHSYTFKVLFPGMSDHVILHPPMLNGRSRQFEIGMQQFRLLLKNKSFLLTFIHTLEEQKTFNIRDKCYVASLLMIIYQDNMEYATDILKALLSELVEKTVGGKHPKLMLRRTESVVEKLLTNWLSLCLFSYLKDHAGSSLFMLYKAIKLQVEKGPVDHLTGDARYSLSEDRLLREKIEPRTMTLNVEHDGEVFQCKALDCDTITQVKVKILDTAHRNMPFSQRLNIHELDLEWRNGIGGHLVLRDEDVTTNTVDGWKRLNTLGHYKVQDGSVVMLTERENSKSLNGTYDSSTLSSITGLLPSIKTPDTTDSGTKVWHLVKQQDDSHMKDAGLKMISEIFLTRLLSTKGTLQQFVDDLFKTVLSASVSLPPVVKYLFDFLDEMATQQGITDPDVVHTWKSNSLPLRFWVNIIKNPDFVFDINKPLIVDSCLSVIAQTFMDSCSTSQHCLGKDSPSNKLLYAKDIPAYKKLVEKFYRDIHDLPPISDQEMSTYMAEVSRMCTGQFNTASALRELFSYVSKYSNEMLIALEEDPITSKGQLSQKLEQILICMQDDKYKKVIYI